MFVCLFWLQSSVVASEKWVEVSSQTYEKFNSDQFTSFYVDLNSLKRVEPNVYQFREKTRSTYLFSKKQVEEIVSLHRVNCELEIFTDLTKHDGIKGDGRFHESEWKSYSDFINPNYRKVMIKTCEFARKLNKSIKQLSMNWEILPDEATTSRTVWRDGKLIYHYVNSPNKKVEIGDYKN